MKPLACQIFTALAAAALCAGCTTSTDTGQSASPTSTGSPPTVADIPGVATPLLATVLAAPIPVPATDGLVHLAYELKVTNSMGSDVTLDSVAVKAGDRTLRTLTGDEIPYWTRILGGGGPTRTLGPAQTGIVWIDIAVDEGDPVPTELSHTIDVSLSKPMPPLLPPTMSEDVALVAVSDRKPPVIAPPLRGPKWLDGNSCCDMTAHRMAMNPLNGELWAAERFAIDYVQLSEDNTIYSGDRSKPESYPYFGSDILAVADGPVVGVMKGLPEQVAGKTPSGLPLDQYGGNHIVQDIGSGNFAFYAHLQTGSNAVEVGDQLSRGQVIAKLGNTGNSDAPHLHFHVMDSPDPLRSNGLPFVIDSYTFDGVMASMDALDPLLDGEPAPLNGDGAPREETETSPLVLDVMTYGE